MLWGAAVVEDLYNDLAKKQEDYKQFMEKINKPFGNDMFSEVDLIPYLREIDNYKKNIANYQSQIANYKLALSNDTEVMYRLFMHRNILKQSISKFLEKVDDKTKQLFLDTLNEMKESKEQNTDYKEKLWAWTNQPDFSQKLLIDIKNPDNLDYTAALLFPNIT